MSKIRQQDSIIFDRGSCPEIGPVGGTFNAGKTVATEINERLMEVVGVFEKGTSFGIDGTIIDYQILGEELRPAKDRTLGTVRRQIGFVFQQPNLLGALTAIQNVELRIRASGRHQRTENHLETLEGLSESAGAAVQ